MVGRVSAGVSKVEAMATKTSATLRQLKELEGQLNSRSLRVRRNFVSIVQGSLSAGIAFWFTHTLLGHERPFFAPMAAVIILGLSSGNRIRRAFELSIGCTLGIGVGDLLIHGIGSGDWQIALAVFVSLLIASFLSTSQLLINQVAVGSILIATIIPPGTSGTYERMFDAVVGCTVGLLVMALIPQSPLAGGRREVARVLKIAQGVLADVADALAAHDAEAIHTALVEVRGSQGAINAMLLEAKSSKENAALSPLLWASKHRVRSFVRILPAVDNVVRNTRVLARRAEVLTQDGEKVSDDQIEIINELSDAVGLLAEVYLKEAPVDEAVAIPELTRKLRYLGARCTLDVAEGGVLSAQVILAQSRSIIVDLLQVCGMSRESAAAALAPTTKTPAFPPEVVEKPESD